jgi:hypothetical protein
VRRKRSVFFGVLVLVGLIGACSDFSQGPLTEYARVYKYRVVNDNYGTGEAAKLRIEYLAAITAQGDTLTEADFDSLEILLISLESIRGELQYPRYRGKNGKYAKGVVEIAFGSFFNMRYQERGN